METDEVVIKVSNVSKTFKLPHEKNTSIKGSIINFYRRRRTFEEQQVLKNISFTVRKGEFFGIIGRNGSGKSTLLKMLAGIYAPNSGDIEVNGKLTPFIELGVGFNPELTGRENVFLNGALLGFNRKEMLAMYDEIVSFAELHKFMDQKLKNYSSGMQVRLAFSIAIRVDTGILVLDEVLAVGDENFQNKCLKVFEAIKRTPDKTVVLVTHDMNSVKRFCDSAILIHDGKLVFNGNAEKAALEYTKLNFPETVTETKSLKNDKISVKLSDMRGEYKTVFLHGDEAKFTINWPKNNKVKNAGVAIFSEKGEYVFGANTIKDNVDVKSQKIEYSVNLNLGNGRYYAQVGLFGEEDTEKLYFLENAAEFSVSSSLDWQGLTHLSHNWSQD